MTNYFVRLITTGLIIFSLTSAALAKPAPRVEVPPVPTQMEVPPGHSVFFYGRATGHIAYICGSIGTGFLWRGGWPQATLFQELGGGPRQVATHLLSPSPIVSPYTDIPQSWQHSSDSSRVWAGLVSLGSTSDPAYVEQGAVDWQLFNAAAAEGGPTGGTLLTQTKYIQRVNTSGGRADSTPGCENSYDLGKVVMIPYAADYFFYREDNK